MCILSRNRNIDIFSNGIWGAKFDLRQRRERHCGSNEGVHQEAAVIAREDEPAATGGGLVASAAEARESEGLAVGEAVEGAVRERQQRERWGQGELPRGGAPLRAHGGEAGPVHAGREETEHPAGKVRREVGPRRRLPGARPCLCHLAPAEANLAKSRETPGQHASVSVTSSQIRNAPGSNEIERHTAPYALRQYVEYLARTGYAAVHTKAAGQQKKWSAGREGWKQQELMAKETRKEMRLGEAG